MKLIFVYNSDGTMLSLIKDTAHKLVSPKTYPCNLCRITYPVATMQAGWQKFIASLPEEPIFLHRDEFHKQYPSQKDVQLPAVFTERFIGPEMLIPHTEINKAQNAKSLIEIVQRFLPKQS